MADTDITIKGASGNIVTLQGVSNISTAFQNQTITIQSDINNAITYGNSVTYGRLTPVSLPLDNTQEEENNKSLIGIINKPTNTTINNHYKYIVVADDDTPSSQINVFLQSTETTLSTNTTPRNTITILAGRKSGFSYTAGNESGQITNTAGDFYFNAEGKQGDWLLVTGLGNANIHTGKGKTNIEVGAGKASIYSAGQDNIGVKDPTRAPDGSFTPYTTAQITLAGGNSSVFYVKNGMITDISNNNNINAFQGTTVVAGTSGTINFMPIWDKIGNNTVQGGTNNTIHTIKTNVTAIHGTNNIFEQITENLTFFNGDGNTTATITKQLIAFGAQGLNFTLNYNSFYDELYDPADDNISHPFTGSSLFVADKGNETLNASGYNNKIEIYANTVTGAKTNFVATGGAGDDVLAAGTGNSTFTGGAGNNLFVFTKEVISSGETVITDFAKQGSNNLIGLYDYGFNSNSIAQLLMNAHNDSNGNAILNLENHKITLEGISVADLKASQFVV